ncbi:hypothetical protein BaRGS_00021827 [Batillaria attramentaria]|uniref:Uncharacterized protein n=1 Tax=Batillaria attramentaria TaxID=370345 RepID=A0ABD0KIE3_9CAEN
MTDLLSKYLVSLHLPPVMYIRGVRAGYFLSNGNHTSPNLLPRPSSLKPVFFYFQFPTRSRDLNPGPYGSRRVGGAVVFQPIRRRFLKPLGLIASTCLPNNGHSGRSLADNRALPG